MRQPRITILSSFHCKYEYAFICARSIAAQRIRFAVEILFLDDGSTDDGYRARFLDTCHRLRATVLRNEMRQGEAFSRLRLVREYLATPRDGDDIVIWLDGDDLLYDADALMTLVSLFTPHTKLVFGRIHGYPQRRYTELPFFSCHDVRTLTWCCSPPRCFRAEMIQNIALTDDMFKHKGEWLASATDQALMYEIIEQMGVDIGQMAYAAVPIMYYRIHAGGTLASRASRQLCLRNEHLIRNRLTDFYAPQ